MGKKSLVVNGDALPTVKRLDASQNWWRSVNAVRFSEILQSS